MLLVIHNFADQKHQMEMKILYRNFTKPWRYLPKFLFEVPKSYVHPTLAIEKLQI